MYASLTIYKPFAVYVIYVVAKLSIDVWREGEGEAKEFGLLYLFTVHSNNQPLILEILFIHVLGSERMHDNGLTRRSENYNLRHILQSLYCLHLAQIYSCCQKYFVARNPSHFSFRLTRNTAFWRSINLDHFAYSKEDSLTRQYSLDLMHNLL